MDKNDQVLYESEKCKDRIHPLQTDRAKMDWNSDSQSVDSSDDRDEMDSDLDDSDDENNSQSSKILFDFDSDDEIDSKMGKEKSINKGKNSIRKNNSQPMNYRTIKTRRIKMPNNQKLHHSITQIMLIIQIKIQIKITTKTSIIKNGRKRTNNRHKIKVTRE